MSELERQRNFEAMCEILENMFPMQNLNIKEILENVRKRINDTFYHIEFEFIIRGPELHIQINKINNYSRSFHIMTDLDRFRYAERSVSVSNFKKEMEEYLYRNIRYTIEKYWLSMIYREDK